MISEAEALPQFRVWLEAHARRAEAQPDYVVAAEEWYPYLQASEQFKQFVRDIPMVTGAIVRVLLQLFNAMMSGTTISQHRCRCWRGLHLLIERMVLERQANTVYPHDQLLQEVIQRLKGYQDFQRGESAVDKLQQKHILAVYLSLLCLKELQPSRVLDLTYVLSKTELVAEELTGQLFKLDEWLQCKSLSFRDSQTLFNIITRGTAEEQLLRNEYDFSRVKIHLKSLLPALLRSLFDQTGEERDKFLTGLTLALSNEEMLLEVYAEHLNKEQSQPVVDCIMRYVSWQMAQSISVKKVKLLLKNLKMETPLPNQTTRQLLKLKSYVDLLKQISRRYPENCMTVDFGTPSSCLTLENFVKEKCATVYFQIDMRSLTEQVSICGLNHKKGLLELILQPERSADATKVFVVVRLSDKILARETVHNNWKPMTEFVVAMSNEGERLVIHVNSVSISLKETTDFAKIQFGAASLHCISFVGRLKAFAVFTSEVKVEELYKEWVDCEGRFQALLRRKKPESLLVKTSRGQTLFRFTGKDKGFLSKLFSKQPKHALSGGACTLFLPSMLYIIEQLGHLDCLLYFIEYINGLAPDDSEAPEILCSLFTILKILCTNDEFYGALDWVQNSLSNLAHLFWLLFIRNGKTSQSVRLILKIFDFLLYFQRRLKYQKNDEALNDRYRKLEYGVIKVILLKFDVWVMCGLTQQAFVLKVIRGRLDNELVLKNFAEENCLGHVLLSLLVHYNPSFHLENRILSEKAIFELQESLVAICQAVLREDKSYTERDFHTVLMYIYVSSQESALEFQCPSIFKLLLRLFLTKMLCMKTIMEFLTNEANASIPQKVSLLFCRMMRGSYSLDISELLLDIVFVLIELLYESIREQVVQAVLVSLSAKSRDSGLSLAPYVQLLKKIAKSSLKNLPMHISRVIASMRQCYKLVGRLNSIEVLEDSLMSLPSEVLLHFINSYEGFDFLLTMSVEQPDQEKRITNIFENLFVWCYSSKEPQLGLPFLRNFLKVFSNVELPANVPPATLHLLCDNIDSKYLVKVFYDNKLLTGQPPLGFITAKEQINDYPGGILGHILSRNSFALEDIERLKSLITKRDRQISSYFKETDIIDYLLPDIVLLEALWTLLRSQMSDFQRKMSGLKSSRKLSTSSDIDSKESSAVKEQPTILEPEAKQLLLVTKEMLDYPSVAVNSAVFGQCENVLATFYEVLNKEQSRELLLGAYVEMNQRLEQTIPGFINQQLAANPLLAELTRKLSIDLSESFDFIYQKRKDFEELLKLMTRYCKKDVTLIRKVCYQRTQPELQLPEPIPTLSSIDYRAESTNELVNDLDEMFRSELSKLDTSSEESEELWKNLNNRNRFWLWDKKGDNDIYKVDLHESPNFYHLNIKRVQEAESRAQYPRRNQASLTMLPVWDKKYERSVIMTASSITEMRERRLTDSASKPSEEESIDTKRRYYAEYVTQRGVYFGALYVKDGCLKFKSLKDSDRPSGKEYQLSTSEFHRLDKPKEKSLALKDAVVFTRRYILRHTAIELFTRNKAYFFNLFGTDRRHSLLNELKDQVYLCIINRKAEWQRHDYTRKWLNGEYNNFEYLMLLNRYSGRTHNDLGQYPVFPWIIANYGNACRQITKDFYRTPANLRNMELPIGRLNEERFEGYKLRMQECDQPEQHFLYGSFYSNPTFIYNFFIRLEPFTTLHWEHQGKKIDHADRLFSGIEEQYRSATTNTSDVRELVPEFYYWPEFLRNRNQIELGKKQNKEEVGDAKLPGWARTPEEFVFKMREALESQQITEQLASWIDLVFGYKSGKEEAEKHDNLFHPYTYEQDIFKLDDLDTIKMIQLNISEFGQVPEPLFAKEHPRKKPRHGIMVDHYRQIYTQPGALRFQLQPQGLVLIADRQLTFLSTNFSIVSRADGKSCDTVSSRCTLLSEKDMSWVTTLDNHLHIYRNRKLRTKLKLESDTYLLTLKHQLVRAQGSQLLVQELTGNDQLTSPQRLFGHQEEVVVLCANENVDVLVSVDRDNLVLVHYISTLKYLRTFKLGLNFGEAVLQLRIHDMGYFVVLTSDNRLLVYTFLGELFVRSDLASDIDGERATNLQFLSEWQSQILLSTNCGSIYQLDFFELWRFKAQFAYLPFRLRPKKNILYRCREDSNKELQYKDAARRQILHFEVLKSSNEFKVLFKVLVLYRDGELLCFYEKEIMKEHIQNSPLLKQMGIV